MPNNYKEQLQQNNNELNAILETVNSLPEAGSGGGNIETCSLIISAGMADCFCLRYVDNEYRQAYGHFLAGTTYEWIDVATGENITKSNTTPPPLDLVVCNSAASLLYPSGYSLSAENAEEIVTTNTTFPYAIFKLTAAPGETATLRCSYIL